MAPEPISPWEAGKGVVLAVAVVVVLYLVAMLKPGFPYVDLADDEDELTPEQVARLEALERARRRSKS